MTPETHATATRDLTLEAACLICGGDLEVRLTAGTARTFCSRCRWLSKPHLHRSGDGVQMVHPTALA